MRFFWSFVFAFLGIGLMVALITPIIYWRGSRSLQRLIEYPSPSLINLIQRLGWRNLIESNLRAATGKALERPFGSPNHFFFLERLQFNPVYLSRRPLADAIEVDTSVVIGPKAKKPLELKIPLLIGGMSYGSALSLRAKMALAKAATMAGTASNSGSGPFLEAERAASSKYIFQLSRGFWGRDADVLSRVDMIEISLGHGAWGSAPVRIKGKKVVGDFARLLGTIPGLDVVIDSRLPEVENEAQWRELVSSFKAISGGVPIAVKIGSTHYLERELDLLLGGGIDVLVLSGAEGGTHAGPVLLEDDMGLPTLPSLCRASKYWAENKLAGQVSLIVGGGLVKPGNFAKCLALGADAILIGTVAALAISNIQVTNSIPWEPPTGDIYSDGKERKKFDPDYGAQTLANYFKSSMTELEALARSLGKKSLREIDRSDLVALDPLYAEMAGVEYFRR